MVHMDMKGYDGTNDTKGYNAYKSTIIRYQWYLGYEKGCENISTVPRRITTGIQYWKYMGFEQ